MKRFGSIRVTEELKRKLDEEQAKIYLASGIKLTHSEIVTQAFRLWLQERLIQEGLAAMQKEAQQCSSAE